MQMNKLTLQPFTNHQIYLQCMTTDEDQLQWANDSVDLKTFLMVTQCEASLNRNPAVAFFFPAEHD